METKILIYGMISAIMIMLVSMSGIIFTKKRFSDWLDKNLSFLISFSAGVFLLIAINLINESFEALGNELIVGISIIAGILFFVVLKIILPESHHHEEDCNDHDHTKQRALRMMIGDGIHNIADGFLLIPAFLISIKLGILTSLGILIHEFLQEISEFFVLKDSGYSTKKAIIYNFLVSTTIIIGVVASFFLSKYDNFIGILLAFAGGSFLYLVIVDLIPYKQLSKNKSIILKHILFFVSGILVFLFLSFLFFNK